MMNKYALILSCGLTFNFSSAICQEQEPVQAAKIQVIARSFGDSIILRWAPDSPLAWKLANENGYMAERYTILKNGKYDKKSSPEKILLTPSPMKPWPLEQWEALAKQDNYAVIAAQSIYGNSFQPEIRTDQTMQLVDKSRELENRFSFGLFSADQSLKVAEACGLKFTDRSIKKGEKYLYKIYSLVPADIYRIDTGFVFIGADENFPLPKPSGLQATFADRTVMLSWNRIYFDHLYSSYIVERSDDGGKTFIRTHDLPVINTSPSENRNAENFYRIDSLPENFKKYLFRIRGITPFEEISPASDIVEGTGNPAPSHAVPHIIQINSSGKGIQILWNSPVEYNDKISRFEILRSDRANGSYSFIADVPPGARDFTDTKPARVNYYIIKATDHTGNSLSSFPALGQVADSIPPPSPTGLKGNIDKNGKFTLRWNKGKEDDIAGYRVYMANSAEEEFTQLTIEAITDTFYLGEINLKTITPKVYFRIMAADLNFNLSALSEALEMKRPDIIPPVPPRIQYYAASDTGIFLRWIPSSSEDVLAHTIYRREKISGIWKSIATFKNEDTTHYFYDKEATIRTEYEYCITATDDSGLESEKEQFVTVSRIDYGIREEVREITIKADRLKKEITLTWNHQAELPEKFLIYRSLKEGDPRIYKTVPGHLRTFSDKYPVMNNTYKYRIQAVYADGSASAISKEIIIIY